MRLTSHPAGEAVSFQSLSSVMMTFLGQNCRLPPLHPSSRRTRAWNRLQFGKRGFAPIGSYPRRQISLRVRITSSSGRAHHEAFVTRDEVRRLRSGGAGAPSGPTVYEVLL